MITLLQKGDIGLVIGNTITDELIKLGTHSPYNHAFLIVDTQGTVIEMQGSGIWKNSLSGGYIRKCNFDIYRTNYPFDILNNVCDDAYQELARKIKYNWGAIVGETFKSILGFFHIPFQKNPFSAPSQDDCSEFVNDMFRAQGKQFDLCPQIADESLVAPGDIAKGGQCFKVYSFDVHGNVSTT